MFVNECENCQCEYEAKRRSSKFCSSACRIASHRKKGGSKASQTVEASMGMPIRTFQRWQHAHRLGEALGDLLGFDYSAAIMHGLKPVRSDIIFVGNLDPDYYDLNVIREAFLRVRTSLNACTTPRKLLGEEEHKRYREMTPKQYVSKVIELAMKLELEESEPEQDG